MAVDPHIQPDPTTVLVAEPHGRTRDAIAMLLDDEPGIEVVATAGDALGVVRAVREHRVDVVLLDEALVGAPGLPSLGALSELGSRASVVLMGIDESPSYTVAARRLGAAGYLSMLAPIEAWIAAVIGAALVL